VHLLSAFAILPLLIANCCQPALFTMSAVWRQHFSYNRLTQIAARALRQSLKEEERLKAEKRGLTAVRYQQWQNGKGGEQVHLNPPEHKEGQPKSAAV